MPTPLAHSPTPEEIELQKKQAQLALLETQLAERELEVATLQAELGAFEREYVRTVGTRYAKLDELLAKIAEAEARREPAAPEIRQRAEKARARAWESREAVGKTLPAQEGETSKPFKPSDSLKRLYREVAKAIHPDLATDDNERARRHTLMAEANCAYEEGDEEKLSAILRHWRTCPESVKGDGPGAELVRTIRKIAQVEARLLAIDGEVRRLKETDLYELKAKCDSAQKAGKDIFAEMIARLDKEVAEAKAQLVAASERGGQ